MCVGVGVCVWEIWGGVCVFVKFIFKFASQLLQKFICRNFLMKLILNEGNDQRQEKAFSISPTIFSKSVGKIEKKRRIVFCFSNKGENEN